MKEQPLKNEAFMTIDLKEIRRQTPGVEDHIHMDNAGASLVPHSVLAAQIDHLQLEARLGGYEAAGQMAEGMDAAYASFARVIGASATEIAFTASATDSWDRAFYSVPLGPGDRVLTGFNEYCSSFVALLHAREQRGFEIVVIGANARGDLDLDQLEAEAKKGAALIAVSHVPSSSGQVNPVVAVGRIANHYGVPYLLDACQSLGQLEVDVKAIGCQMASFTGRKFLRGPRGMGALYIEAEFMNHLTPVFVTNQSAQWMAPDRFELRTDAKLFEAWERNVAAQLGFGAACDYLLGLDRQAIYARLAALSTRLRDGLAAIPGVEVLDPGAKLAAIVTCNLEGITPWQVREKMAQQGITTQVAGAQHTRIDMDARGIKEAVRLSPHYFLREEDIDATLEGIKSIAA